MVDEIMQPSSHTDDAAAAWRWCQVFTSSFQVKRSEEWRNSNFVQHLLITVEVTLQLFC